MSSTSLASHMLSHRERLPRGFITLEGRADGLFSVGNLRLRRPLPIPRAGPSKQLFSALEFSHSCPQQNYTLPRLPDIDYSPLRGFVTKVNASEDCEPSRMTVYGNITGNFFQAFT